MVIELVLLRPRPGVTDTEFVAAAEAAMPFLRSCRGFIRRRLARNDDGEWADYIEWNSMEDALAAAQAFGSSPATAAFNDAIERTSVRMQHFAVQCALG